MPPKSDHLLPDAYPARMTPNTSLDRTARMKNADTFRSLPTTSLPRGSETKATNEAQKARYGASLKRNLSATSGAVSSLTRSLMASATIWGRPNSPRRVGPRRSCIRPDTLRSSQTKMLAVAATKLTTMTPITRQAATKSNGAGRKEKSSFTAVRVWARGKVFYGGSEGGQGEQQGRGFRGH